MHIHTLYLSRPLIFSVSLSPALFFSVSLSQEVLSQIHTIFESLDLYIQYHFFTELDLIRRCQLENPNFHLLDWEQVEMHTSMRIGGALCVCVCVRVCVCQCVCVHPLDWEQVEIQICMEDKRETERARDVTVCVIVITVGCVCGVCVLCRITSPIFSDSITRCICVLHFLFNYFILCVY